MSDIAIVGGSFAGLAAALELRKQLPGDVSITVISASDSFVFMPSLIWVMQGWRDIEDISFSIHPVLEEAGVTFVHARLEQIDPNARTLRLQTGESVPYDRLLIAAGGEWAWDLIPGSKPKPDGNTVSILSVSDALRARDSWRDFLEEPGPIVIGIGLGAGLFGAAYELALNLDTALRQAGKREQAEILFITPEPYLGHFGIEGIGNSRAVIEEAFAHRGILSATEQQISRVDPNRLVADPLHYYESKLTMVIPPYRGIKPVRETPKLTDPDGLILVDEYQRSTFYPMIYAAGTAARLDPASSTLLPLGRFVPGTVSAELGRIAARNIAADLGHGEAYSRNDDDLKGFYVLDTGGEGMLMSLGTQPWLNLQLRVPGPWSHWAKSVAERYQMWQLQTGQY